MSFRVQTSLILDYSTSCEYMFVHNGLVAVRHVASLLPHIARRRNATHGVHEPYYSPFLYPQQRHTRRPIASLHAWGANKHVILMCRLRIGVGTYLIGAARAVPLLQTFDQFTVKHAFKNTQIFFCHQWLSDSFKLHEICFRQELRPGPRWGSLQRSPRPS